MLNYESLVQKIENENISEVFDHNVELKSSWKQNVGKTISAFANLNNLEASFIVIGVADNGNLLGLDEKWAKNTEHEISGHLNEYLSPISAVTEIKSRKTSKGCYIIITVSCPGDITEWDEKYYKRVGTSTIELSPDERLNLSLNLPGSDYSKQQWQGEISFSLISEFAKKLIERNNTSLPADLSKISAEEILQRIHCDSKMASNILFGQIPVRIAYYDENNDVIKQTEKKGVFSILTSDFVESIQVWTKSKGTILNKSSLSAVDEPAYDLKSLRECFANAIAHALYEREDGAIVIELYPNRISVRNNCSLDVKKFAKEWFSKKTYTKNKFLMQLLRESGFTDELGSGKIRLFSQALESGKKEPIIDFYEKGNFGCWSVTLYNELINENTRNLLHKFKELFSSIDEARLALAMVLWHEKKWSEIKEKFDRHYESVAVQIIKNEFSPILVIGEHILLKRWVNEIILGKNNISFTPHEEILVLAILKKFAFENNRGGCISMEHARSIIGIPNDASSIAQLTHLFKKWKKQEILDNHNRGEWKFNSAENTSEEIIMSVID